MEILYAALFGVLLLYAVASYLFIAWVYWTSPPGTIYGFTGYLTAAIIMLFAPLTLPFAWFYKGI